MKKIIIVISLLAGMYTLQAQEQFRHEWNINAGGGVSTLHYKPIESGNTGLGLGGSFGLGYTYFMSYRWGIATGIEAAMYNTTLTINDLQVKYPIATPANLQGNFLFQADYAGFEEKQRAFLFQVPVMLHYQVPLDNKFFYIGAGVKLGIPISTTYNQSSASITTTGYSDYADQLFGGMPNHSLSIYKSPKSSNDLDLNMAQMVSLESGIKWRLSDKNTLYTGIYFDYGFNNIRKEAPRELLSYNTEEPANYQYNSFLQSHLDNKPLAGSVAPLAFGIKLKWTFGSGKKMKNPRKTDSDRDGVMDKYDRCPDTPIGIKVDLNGCPIDSDGDGVPDYLDKCPDTPAGVEVDKNGCPIDSDGDGVPDYLDKCPKTYGTIDGCPEVKAEAKKVFEQAMYGIYFETNKYEIKPLSFPLLDKIVSILNENPEYRLLIEGHTDNVGTEEYNETLSGYRVQAVVNYLVHKGINSNRFKAIGYGETKPIATNETVDGRAKNRRVEFIVRFE